MPLPGRLLVYLEVGQISKGSLAFASGDIISQLLGALNPLAKDERHTNLERGIFYSNIVDGLATLDSLVLQTDRVAILAGGEIDLESEKINLEFNTKPRQGIGISEDNFVTPFVKIDGSPPSSTVTLFHGRRGATRNSLAAATTEPQSRRREPSIGRLPGRPCRPPSG